MEKISVQKCFGGTVGVYKHDSKATSCPMTFSIFMPPQAASKNVPVLFWLSGLTCTHENFTTKAGAYRKAAELGIAIVVPDTSPRGQDVPDDAAYDLGQGAGFYVDATQEPWAKHYKMETYVAKELPALLKEHFKYIDLQKIGIFGHSMGGHGALTLFSVTAICFIRSARLRPSSRPRMCRGGKRRSPRIWDRSRPNGRRTMRARWPCSPRTCRKF